MGRQAEEGKPGTSVCRRAWSAGDKVVVVLPAWLRDLLSALPRDSSQVVRSLWATTLFCNTGDISLLLPTREGPLAGNEQPGRHHSWTNGLKHISLGYVPSRLGRTCQLPCLHRGCGRGASSPAWWLAEDLLPCRALVLGHVRAGSGGWKERKTADGLCPGIPRTEAMAEQPLGSSLR